MSMISAQCDELRRIADKDTVPYEASDAMYLAADTIWELRCKLAGVVDQQDEIERLNAENEMLRKLLSGALICAGTEGRHFLDTYLREEEGVTLWQELRSLGIEVG